MARKKGKAIYYPKQESQIVGYYNNAVTKLAGLASKYGISTAVMTLLQTHNTNVKATYDQAVADAAVAHDSNQIKYNEFAQAKFDILSVFQQIQRAPNFEEGDAELLGFRVITQPPDLNAVKPVITGITILNMKIVLDWVKGQMDGVVVYGSYNGVDFTELGQDTRSPYYDTRKNKTDQPEVRHYKMQYLKNDEIVGLESEVYKIVAQIF